MNRFSFIGTLFLLTYSSIFFVSGCNINNDDGEDPQISLFDLNKMIVEINVTNTAIGLGNVFSSMITDSSDRTLLSQAFVREAFFFPDKSGYFFIETLDSAVVIAHINESYIGTSRYYVQDLNGKYHVQEIIDTVKTSGSGFVEYVFMNPATEEIEDKLSFVSALSPPNWFIGAGFYYNNSTINEFYDFQEGNEMLVKDIVETNANGLAGIFESIYNQEFDPVMLSSSFVDDISFFEDGSGYLFILDFDGISIAHGEQKELEGQNLWDLQDTQDTFIVRDMVEIAQSSAKGGFYDYFWENPATGNEEQKRSFIMQIPNTNYLIGAGVYEE